MYILIAVFSVVCTCSMCSMSTVCLVCVYSVAQCVYILHVVCITRAMLKHSKASERIASYQFGAKIGPINTSETVATCMQVKTCEPPSLGKPHPLHLINIILLAGIAS